MIANRSNERQSRGLSPWSSENPAGEQRGVLLAALLMFVSGWGGLAYLVMTTRPRIGGEIWLFFILLQIAVTGTAIPIVRWISQRLGPAPADAPLTGVIVRRSVWAGIIVVTCAWLMIPRYLSLPIFLMLVLLFLVVEGFLRNRELAHER